MLRTATHTNAARHEIKQPALFRISRTSDTHALHADASILPPFELAAKHFPAAGAEEHFAEVEGADEHCELTNGQVGSFLVQLVSPRKSVSFSCPYNRLEL
jgi:hypothetical protein